MNPHAFVRKETLPNFNWDLVRMLSQLEAINHWFEPETKIPAFVESGERRNLSSVSGLEVASLQLMKYACILGKTPQEHRK